MGSYFSLQQYWDQNLGEFRIGGGQSQSSS